MYYNVLPAGNPINEKMFNKKGAFNVYPELLHQVGQF